MCLILRLNMSIIHHCCDLWGSKSQLCHCKQRQSNFQWLVAIFSLLSYCNTKASNASFHVMGPLFLKFSPLTPNIHTFIFWKRKKNSHTSSSSFWDKNVRTNFKIGSCPKARCICWMQEKFFHLGMFAYSVNEHIKLRKNLQKIKNYVIVDDWN